MVWVREACCHNSQRRDRRRPSTVFTTARDWRAPQLQPPHSWGTWAKESQRATEGTTEMLNILSSGTHCGCLFYLLLINLTYNKYKSHGRQRLLFSEGKLRKSLENGTKWRGKIFKSITTKTVERLNWIKACHAPSVIAIAFSTSSTCKWYLQHDVNMTKQEISCLISSLSSVSHSSCCIGKWLQMLVIFIFIFVQWVGVPFLSSQIWTLFIFV